MYTYIYMEKRLNRRNNKTLLKRLVTLIYIVLSEIVIILLLK